MPKQFAELLELENHGGTWTALIQIEVRGGIATETILGYRNETKEQVKARADEYILKVNNNQIII